MRRALLLLTVGSLAVGLTALASGAAGAPGGRVFVTARGIGERRALRPWVGLARGFAGRLAPLYEMVGHYNMHYVVGPPLGHVASQTVWRRCMPLRGD